MNLIKKLKELNAFLKELHLHIKDSSDAGYICSLIRQKVKLDIDQLLEVIEVQKDALKDISKSPLFEEVGKPSGVYHTCRCCGNYHEEWSWSIDGEVKNKKVKGEHEKDCSIAMAEAALKQTEELLGG